MTNSETNILFAITDRRRAIVVIFFRVRPTASGGSCSPSPEWSTRPR